MESIIGKDDIESLQKFLSLSDKSERQLFLSTVESETLDELLLSKVQSGLLEHQQPNAEIQIAQSEEDIPVLLDSTHIHDHSMKDLENLLFLCCLAGAKNCASLLLDAGVDKGSLKDFVYDHMLIFYF